MHWLQELFLRSFGYHPLLLFDGILDEAGREGQPSVVVRRKDLACFLRIVEFQKLRHLAQLVLFDDEDLIVVAEEGIDLVVEGLRTDPQVGRLSLQRGDDFLHRPVGGAEGDDSE